MFKKQLLLASTTAAGIAVLSGYLGIARNQAQAAETQEVDLKFSGQVGEKPFNCGESYSNLGMVATTVTPTDFRFYVSEIALIDANGKAVPVTLKQDGKWQHQNVALLDFENKSSACANGTVEIRDRILGTIPKGNYKGLQFTLGVPFNLNHEDATLAPSPLNLTSLWWNWRGGYKFLRIDMTNPSKSTMPGSHSQGDRIQANPSTKPEQHSPENNQNHGNTAGFVIHLGSTGCTAGEKNQQPSTCKNPNQAKVVFNNFDPAKNTVVADIKSLVANSNLAINQPNTPPGCMSDPKDSDCTGIMNNLGLPFDGKVAGKQTFFKVK
ncbi:MAG TPA: metallo-mystery pair system four-Cys motif protein [Microcoleaceae bacterium UBA10368]|jgi:AZL_007920/MXAN_0976 family protein|nr:metallo-mystery pair system four-Cys motif protein [Microcoleaceae cyanobacterium UBA10368]HCV31834.1 metallo-mystery pair system four-Cys motif protein [Microcoleaceae cyanobacterium UBA9251]